MSKKKQIEIGEHSYIPDSKNIRYLCLKAGNYVQISDDVEILCPNLSLGNNVFIGKGTQIKCRSLEIGSDTFIQGDVLIEGALNNLETRVKIGREGLICTGTRINCNYPVNIGNHVGIGQNVRIWTHGYFLHRLKGGPYNVGSVKIGDDVWLIEGSVVMPGIEIGNHAIIGTNSLVNKDVPPRSFVAGQPAKVIKEKVYPIEIPREKQERILEKIVSKYKPIMRAKGFHKEIQIDGLKIHFDFEGKHPLVFDCETIKMRGSPDEFGEDFRDYLRRNSVKFFNGTPFKSIMLPEFKKLIEEKY